MLSLMAKGFFSDSPVLFLPLLALFLFIGVFVLVVIRVLRTDKESLLLLAELPLAGDLRTRPRQRAGGADHE